MKKIVTLFLLFVLNNITTYSIALDQATFKVGQQFFDKKLYSEAEKRFLDIVRKYPDSDVFHSSLYYLGQTYAHMGKYKSALHYYRLLLDKSPSIRQRQQAILGIAKSWLQLGQHSKAGDFYSFYVSEYAESEYAPAALYFAGISRERSGDNNAAIEKYRALLDNYPQSDYYSQSIEKIAMLTSSTPETLWITENDSSNNALAKQYNILPKDPMAKQLNNQNKVNNIQNSSINSAFNSSYKDAQYKAQLSENVFITDISPNGYIPMDPNTNISYSQPIPQMVQNNPTIVTQLIQSPPIVITQQIEAPKTVLTQNVIQIVTQQIEVPSETRYSMSQVDQEIVQDKVSLKQQELETYKKIWEDEYQLKLKKQELQETEQNIKKIAELSSEKAQILQVKENVLLEKQDQIHNMLYSDLSKILKQNPNNTDKMMISNIVFSNNTANPSLIEKNNTTNINQDEVSSPIEDITTDINQPIEDTTDYINEYDSDYNTENIDIDDTYADSIETTNEEDYSDNEYAQ